MSGEHTLTEEDADDWMSRRTVLRTAGIAGVVGLAGCMGDGDNTGDGTPTATEDDDGMGDGTPTETDDGTTDITDLAGRTVSVPTEIEDVIAVGPGALRIVAQVGAADMAVGVEERETTFLTEAPYNMANPSLREQPTIGGGSDNPERIVGLEPDVVFSTGGTEELNTLQSQTQIPTIGIGTGELIDIGAPLLEDVWSFVGGVLDREDETDQMVSFLEETKADYPDRTADISEDEMPSIYIAAISFRGGQGLNATRPLFASFELLERVNNVAADIEYEGIPHVTVSREQLLEWDPEIIFVDRGNLDLVREDVDNRPEYEDLTAIQEGNVHGILPHAQYALNHASILANTYYMGQVMYPDAFGDIDIEARADEIFEAVYGQPLYDDLVEIYGGYEAVALT